MLPVSSIEFHKTIPLACNFEIFLPCISAVTIFIRIVTQTGDATFWRDNSLNKDNIKTYRKIHEQFRRCTAGPSDCGITIMVSTSGLLL